MKNNLTTTQKTEVVLAKSKSLLGITAKILSGSKALATPKSKDLATTGKLMWEELENPWDNEMNWHEAMEYAKNLRLGGYDDWRLPTIEEFKSVVEACGGINVTYEDEHNGYTYNENVYENTDNASYQACYAEKGFANLYWSSTAYAGGTSYAWYVHFYCGGQGNQVKSYSYAVRCVRAGQ